MLEIDSELVRLTMRIGYSAAWNGLFPEALKIFRGVSAVRPDSEVPLIGAGVVGMLSGDYEMSRKALERAIENNPESDLAKAHLGCLLRLSGEEEEGKAMLEAICANSTDADAKSMAANVKDLPVEELYPVKKGS